MKSWASKQQLLFGLARSNDFFFASKQPLRHGLGNSDYFRGKGAAVTLCGLARNNDFS